MICVAKASTQPPQSSAPLRYSSVAVCWSTTFCGVETICRSGFIVEGLDTIRCIMEIKHTTYGPTYTPREPPAASREATTPTHKFFLTSLPFTGSIIDTISILVATNLAVRQASGVRTSHENRRSLEARQRRHQLRNDKRRQSRRDYRSWIRSVLEGGKFTLAHPRRPMKRVNNSPAQLRRAYFNQRFHPTIGSRASLFHRYVQPSLLDLPVRHLVAAPVQ